MTSDKKNVSLLADIFVQKGLSNIIISPGSRNAPLVLAFAGHESINALSIVDERSAGFFALGMAQQTGKTIAVACTSGSAALNYAPAIAEAFYQKIPLLVLTADRPPELIDQGDGQTVKQKDVFSNYIKRSFELPIVIDDPATKQIAENVINEAIDQTMFPEPGPVHINIPLRAPLYGSSQERITGKLIDTNKPIPELNDEQLQDCAEEWNSFEKIMIIVGQNQPDPVLNRLLSKLAKFENVVVLTETTSNLNNDRFIDCMDNVVSTISDEDAEDFKPDLLISIGGQVVSKMVKKFLRLNAPRKHWHISVSGEEMDTYFVLSKVIKVLPATFFERISRKIEDSKSDFGSLWKTRKDKIKIRRGKYLENIPYSDLMVWDVLLKEIPANTILHLGNSTPVRYSQLFGSLSQFIYRSNRGVSGIDGQVSTAAGSAFASKKINTIITGDLGFFYDSNALMNHHLTPNLKIIVINNGGGGIFRFIPGPDTSPFLEKYFETSHNWKAEKIAEAFDIKYFKTKNKEELMAVLSDFYESDQRPAILEIFTPSKTNARVLRGYFKYIQQ